MANSPAKNISSLDSQTIVPTLTMFGRFSEWMRALIAGSRCRHEGIMTPGQLLQPVGIPGDRRSRLGGTAARTALRRRGPLQLVLP